MGKASAVLRERDAKFGDGRARVAGHPANAAAVE
jgi:hypothetical protein